jgi:hypothetical protein
VSENHAIHIATDHESHDIVLREDPSLRISFSAHGAELVRYGARGVVEFQHHLTPTETERLIDGWLHWKGEHPTGLVARQSRQALGH